MKKKDCCEKCNGRVEDENGFGRYYGCQNENCDCHQEPPMKDIKQEILKEFEEKFRWWLRTVVAPTSLNEFAQAWRGELDKALDRIESETRKDEREELREKLKIKLGKCGIDVPFIGAMIMNREQFINSLLNTKESENK